MSNGTTPTVTSVTFGLNKMANQKSFIVLQGTNLGSGETVNIVSTTDPKETWAGSILKQLTNGWLAWVTYTGTAREPSSAGAVETLNVTVTSGNNTSPAYQVQADVYSAN